MLQIEILEGLVTDTSSTSIKIVKDKTLQCSVLNSYIDNKINEWSRLIV